MTDSYSILFMGSSAMLYTEAAGALPIPAIVQKELKAATGGEWPYQVELLFPAPSMAERVEQLVERYRPDAALIWFTSIPFAEDFVVYSIRNRAPALYPAAVSIANSLRSLAGGGVEGSASPRGMTFRVPRRVASELIGAAPMVPLDHAIDYASAAVAWLARQETLGVVCRLSVPVPFDSSRKAESERRVRMFNDALAKRCKSLGIDAYDPVRAMAAKGLVFDYAQDEMHDGPFTAAFEGRRIAEGILHSLDLPRALI